jgi:hypothetical protein
MTLPTFMKAIVAAAMAALSSLAVVLVGDTGFGDLTDGQWVTVLLATIAAGAAVYGVPNGAEYDPETSTPQP